VPAEQLSLPAEWHQRQILGGFPHDVLGDIRLPFAPTAPSAARSLVHALALAWDVGHVAEQAELCVSEIVTNAYQHAAEAGPHPLRLIILQVKDRLRYEVYDASPKMPRPKHPDTFDESGRGLFLLEMTAEDHGAYRLSVGKSVWFELVAWSDHGDRQ